MLVAQRTKEQPRLHLPIVVLSDTAKKSAIDGQLRNEFGDMLGQVTVYVRVFPCVQMHVIHCGWMVCRSTAILQPCGAEVCVVVL